MSLVVALFRQAQIFAGVFDHKNIIYHFVCSIRICVYVSQLFENDEACYIYVNVDCTLLGIVVI